METLRCTYSISRSLSNGTRHEPTFQQSLIKHKPVVIRVSLIESTLNTIFQNPNNIPFISPKITMPEPLLMPLNAPHINVPSESLRYESGFLGSVPEKLSLLEGDAMSYLVKILSSKVYDVAHETPLEHAPKISEMMGVNLWLKREDLQPVKSFKIRGAYNMMARLSNEKLNRGVITSSAGNHAQGVALAAKKLNCRALIVMPITTPIIKIEAVKRMGAKVKLVGETYDEAQAYARKKGKEYGMVFIHPFDHPDIIAGQGTIGMEIVRQMPPSLHAIFVPVGGGGLIAGVAAFIKTVCPEVRVIGVEPNDANAMALSIHNEKRIVLEKVDGFADGVAVKSVGEETLRLCMSLIDGIVLVDRESICTAIKDMYEETRSIIEPAGALALAGAHAYCKYYKLKDENVVAITSGANMNFDKLEWVVQITNSS